MKNILVNILNLLDPEMAHKFAIYAISSGMLKNKALPKIPIQLGNLNFQHPLGLAAGFDKSEIVYIDIAFSDLAKLEEVTHVFFPNAGCYLTWNGQHG